MSERACGSCTMCCKVLQIDELDKPAGAWCPNCAIGKGCKVYDERPGPCRGFVCIWLTESALPDSLRPDRSKVVLAALSSDRITAYCDPADPMAWRREPVYGMLKTRAADRAHPAIVAARAGSRMWVLAGQGPDQDLGHIDADTEVAFETLPGGGVRVHTRLLTKP